MHPNASILSIFIGICMILSAFIQLWIQGERLPMNPYPSVKFVTTGVYKFFAHPAYIGCSMISFGLSMYCQSESGFWLVSPILTLAWCALVHGYENEHLRKRFPTSSFRPMLDLPDDISNMCQLSDILSAYGLVLIPWLLLYQSIIFMGTSRHAISTYPTI
jgi:hypothetical protein